ncbi:hypothetical protein BANRA_02273 [Escherichia coli]|nr:hypothetical protein BANRA_02273 [Escherichia coli]
MSAYTVSQLAHNAGVSVHIVRDYRARLVTAGGLHHGRLRRVRRCGLATAVLRARGLRGGYRPMPARLCRALDAADGAQAAAQLAVLRQLVERRRAALAHLDAQLASMPAERAHEEALP